MNIDKRLIQQQWAHVSQAAIAWSIVILFTAQLWFGLTFLHGLLNPLLDGVHRTYDDKMQRKMGKDYELLHFVQENTPRGCSNPANFDHAMQTPDPQDQHVVEAFPPYTAQKSFANGVGLGSSVRRFQDFNRCPRRCCPDSESKNAALFQTGSPRAVVVRPRHPWDERKRQSERFAVKLVQ